jgi:hypothetical protein
MFPNAIGIHLTDQAKHVFGSFLSRETAYQLMQSVSKSINNTPAITAELEDEVDVLIATESSKEDSSSLSSEAGKILPETTGQQITSPFDNSCKERKQEVEEAEDGFNSYSLEPMEIVQIPATKNNRNSIILLLGIAFTLILAFFSTFLLIRINSIENCHARASNYEAMSADEAEQVLNRNLMTVRNVRQKLEELQSILQKSYREEHASDHEL